MRIETIGEPGQGALFDDGPAWAERWKGMPSYEHDDLEPWRSVKVHFRNRDDMKAFGEIVGQNLLDATRSIWYPEAEIGRHTDRRYSSSEPINPGYPVYVISKGRWESRLTSRALERIGVPYRVVVEPLTVALRSHPHSPDFIDPLDGQYDLHGHAAIEVREPARAGAGWRR